MKTYKLILTLLFTLNVSLSFGQDTLYFDYFNNKVKKKTAYYSRTEVYNEDQTKATVKEKYISGNAKSFKKIMRNSKGDLITNVTEWYENGNAKSAFTLVNSKLIGDLNCYRETGGLYFRKTFVRDSLKGTTFFEEDGTAYPEPELSAEMPEYNEAMSEQPRHNSTQKPGVIMPEFTGGIKMLYKFLQQNLKYPMPSARAGNQGKVYVTFIVDESGSIKFPMVDKGIDMLIDLETLRVVSLMPKWSPGTIDGRPVKVQYTMPVKFVLN